MPTERGIQKDGPRFLATRLLRFEYSHFAFANWVENRSPKTVGTGSQLQSWIKLVDVAIRNKANAASHRDSHSSE